MLGLLAAWRSANSARIWAFWKGSEQWFLDMLGVSRLRIGAKFGHLEAECPGREAEEGILTCSNMQNMEIFAVEISSHMPLI